MSKTDIYELRWPIKQHEKQLLQARELIKCVSFPVKQKQAELDDLNFKLHYTQKYNEALHGDVKAKKNFNQKTRTQKKIAEEQKLQQVMSRLKLEIQRVGFSVMV